MSWAYGCHSYLRHPQNAMFPSEELFCNTKGQRDFFFKTSYFQALEPFGLS